MSEIQKASQEPVRLIDAINTLAGQGMGDPAAAAVEADRKRQADLVDAGNAVRDTTEQRAELIERAQGGEAIDPDVLRYSGELALEARVHEQGLLADDGRNNSA